MAFTYDVTTDRGKVRLLAFDTDASNQMFDDSEIDAFLSMESSSVRRAAALALETVAVQEVLIQKVIRNMDLSTDGSKVSQELRARARELRQQEDEMLDADYPFDWAEMVPNQFAWREHIWNDAMRRGL